MLKTICDKLLLLIFLGSATVYQVHWAYSQPSDLAQIESNTGTLDVGSVIDGCFIDETLENSNAFEEQTLEKIVSEKTLPEETLCDKSAFPLVKLTTLIY